MYVTVQVEGVNDNPPELSVVPRGDNFVENGGPVELLRSVNLTDADNNEFFNITALHVCDQLITIATLINFHIGCSKYNIEFKWQLPVV